MSNEHFAAYAAHAQKSQKFLVGNPAGVEPLFSGSYRAPSGSHTENPFLDKPAFEGARD